MGWKRERIDGQKAYLTILMSFLLRNEYRPGHPGGALHIFWVRGRAIGKGIYFQGIGIKNGINFHNFGIRNGTDLQDFAMKYKVGYSFSQNWYKFGYTFSKNWYKERVCF